MISARSISRLFLALAAVGSIASLPARAAQPIKVLFAFDGYDGATPQADHLVMDGAGALYGTTFYGGDGIVYFGTVYKLTPPAAGKTAWTETILHAFTGKADGSYPDSSLVIDKNGAVYGTAAYGGLTTGSYCAAIDGCGVVFKLDPPAAGKTAWTESVIYTFTGGTDGNSPSNDLVMDASGQLYGVTYWGGHDADCKQSFVTGCGVVFRLTPPAKGATAWTESVLYRFTGGKDGANPEVMLRDATGRLYGITATGGTDNFGVVYQLAPPASGKTAWTQSVLHSFTGGSDGASPGVIIEDTTGGLYGTANAGGTDQDGLVFRLTPPSTGKGSWVEQILYDFTATNPINQTWLWPLAFNGLTLAKDGTLYGTAAGGPDSEGMIYHLLPPAKGKTAWTETLLHGFTGGAGGAGPSASLIIGPSGALYGTAAWAGNKQCTIVAFGGCGLVFELEP